MTAVGAVPVLALAAGVAALVPAIGSSGDGGSGDGAAAGVQVETMPVVDGQTVFTLHGHGHGHGRGMGQWGAYG
ncbi:MAG: stage II sporulation protein SpoIID, partial [Tomitella sp.]|nr:stage II sporulation protein SpoIID [Tomitella sp.]